MNAALRRRIVSAMPKILCVIANDWRIGIPGPHIGAQNDFRRLIIAGICKIAEPEPLPPYRVQERIKRAANHLKRARQAVDCPAIDAALKHVEALQPPAQITRKQRAAALACELLVDWGAYGPTLADNGPYVRLASLLLATATGDRGRDLKRACMAHIKTLQDAPPLHWPDTERNYGLPTPEFKRRLCDDVMSEHERRQAAIEKWPPLLQIIENS
jgi:hypothetical protein